MLKRKINATIVTAILLAGPAIVPVSAHGSVPNGPVAQQDKMKDDKMTGNKMSSKGHKRRRHRKHKMGGKMNTMQGNKNQ